MGTEQALLQTCDTTSQKNLNITLGITTGMWRVGGEEGIQETKSTDSFSGNNDLINNNKNQIDESRPKMFNKCTTKNEGTNSSFPRQQNCSVR